MKELFELVKERPDDSLTRETVCPYCGSTNIQELGHVETLLANFGNEDPNHHWITCHCQDCEKEFGHEYKEGNHWYVERETKKVLKGIPSCYEFYVYTCTHCDGDVVRKYTSLDSGSLPGADRGFAVLSTIKGVKQYRTFYECKSCGEKVETPDEYYHG